MSLVGCHFTAAILPNWRKLRPLFDERAVALGREPPGEKLKARMQAVTYSGTVDRRLRVGSLRYDAIGFGVGTIAGMMPGRTDVDMRFHFGVQHADDLDATETCGFGAFGLFLPEEQDITNDREAPHRQLADFDLWAVLNFLAAVEAGTSTPTKAATGDGYMPLPSAPGWTFRGGSRAWSFGHSLVNATIEVTPMMLG